MPILFKNLQLILVVTVSYNAKYFLVSVCCSVSSANSLWCCKKKQAFEYLSIFIKINETSTHKFFLILRNFHKNQFLLADDKFLTPNHHGENQNIYALYFLKISITHFQKYVVLLSHSSFANHFLSFFFFVTICINYIKRSSVNLSLCSEVITF